VDKNQVLQTLLAQLHEDFKILKQAALATYEDATHEETKPENKYDTRALEASYLAGAQAQRVSDTSELILFCQNLRIRPQEKVAVGALVTVETTGKKNYFFFLPKGGGITIQDGTEQIQVMTPSSPLGKALLGLSQGDTAEITMSGQKKVYEILAVI